MKRRIGFFLAASVLALAAAGCSLAQYCPMHMAMRALSPKRPSADQAGQEIQQTTCPVMGGKIDPKVYTDHEGRRVYFCCPGCIGTFKKDPQKYLAKLK